MRFLLAGVLLLLSFSTPAAIDLQTMLRFHGEVIEWIGANSDYDVSKFKKKDWPVVIFAPPKVIKGMWKMHMGVQEEVDVKAFYRHSYIGGIIYYPNDFDLENVLDRKTGVHEMVHAVQFGLGIVDTYKCDQESEKDAYNLAALYMEQQGGVPQYFIDEYRKKADTQSTCK